MAPVRVLIVDDSAPFRGVVRQLLRRRGYAVVAEVDCAAAAMRVAAGLEVDAALIDVNLPDLNGFELARRLTRVNPRLAVVLTSARYDDCFPARAEESRSRGFIPKSHLAQVDLTIFWG